MLNDYGRALREFITTEGYAVRHIIEAHDVETFESEVSAYPELTVIEQESRSTITVSKALPSIEREKSASVSGAQNARVHARRTPTQKRVVNLSPELAERCAAYPG